MLELEETEQQEEAKEGEAAEKNKRVALHLTANLKGMDTLFEDMSKLGLWSGSGSGLAASRAPDHPGQGSKALHDMT